MRNILLLDFRTDTVYKSGGYCGRNVIVHIGFRIQDSLFLRGGSFHHGFKILLILIICPDKIVCSQIRLALMLGSLIHKAYIILGVGTIINNTAIGIFQLILHANTVSGKDSSGKPIRFSRSFKLDFHHGLSGVFPVWNEFHGIVFSFFITCSRSR